MAGSGLGATIREAHRRLELDARSYLDTLYRGQPDGTLIAVGSLRRPHFCRTTADAIPYVLGAHDVYARITLLGARPASGRGAAADSVYLPGVWAEVDVNGGPRTSGGLVDDGAVNLEMAVELAHAVLAPTLLVRSGYGLHAYWLFEAMLDVRETAAREAAGRLVEGWQRRLRAAAADLGIRGLDSTFDLARVFRPAGTFNGKGDGEPVPVTLLDDGGPRYTPEQIEGEVLAPVVTIAPVVPAVANGTPRTVDELVARYSALGRIARREGKAPKGGSPSDWDYYLACEARRRVKPPITRGEATELVAYGRGFGDDPRGKGSRRDYLERTVDKAFAEVDPPAGPAPATADPIAVINTGWKLTVDPITNGWATGRGLDSVVYLRRAGGEVIRLRRLGDLFVASRHYAQVSVALREPIPTMSPAIAGRTAQAIIQACGVRDDDDRDRDEVEEWLDAFVHGLGAQIEGDLLGEGEPRWRVLVAQRDYVPREPGNVAAATAGVRDLDGRLWVPSRELMRHIRSTERAQIDWPALLSRLDDLNWDVLRVDVHEPGAGKSGRHIRAVFYGEPNRASES